MSEEQGFIGIRSGLTGETVIMCLEWFQVGEKRSLLAWAAGSTFTRREVLGSGVLRRRGKVSPVVHSRNGEFSVLPDTITWTDAAMDILQYLSDRCDPRLRLGEAAAWG